MTIVTEILERMSGITKPQRKFLLNFKGEGSQRYKEAALTPSLIVVIAAFTRFLFLVHYVPRSETRNGYNFRNDVSDNTMFRVKTNNSISY